MYNIDIGICVARDEMYGVGGNADMASGGCMGVL